MNAEELLTLREGWDFEAKLAGGRDGRGALPESLWETYAAMANTQGGQILLGAKERRDGSLELKGILDLDKVERDFWNTVQNPQKVSANVLSRDHVRRIEVEGKTLLLIEVPKASRTDRPVHLNGSWERGTFLRVHEVDRRADRERARRMLADSIRDRDSGVLDDFTLDDLDADSIRRYREYFAVRRPDHTFIDKNDEDFLVAIEAAKRPRGGDGVARPTWAGLWMLGDEASIRELLPPWHLSFKELPDDPRDPRRWPDRVHPDGMWNANLFEFYLRAIRKLHDGLKVPFALEQGQFRVDETPVHDAVREGLVNMLVHADYQGTTGLRAIKGRFGFEFINPGLLLVPAEQVWRGGVSEPRNPALQRLFGFLRLGEREGSGGPTMRRVWQDQHWRAPRLQEDLENNETHLVLPTESLLPTQAVEALEESWGDDFRLQGELGRTILVTAQAEGSVNHARMRELSDAHPHDLTMKFQELVRNGMLESQGRTRGTFYTTCLPSNDVSSKPNAATSEPNDASSGANDASSGANDASSGANDASSGANDISSEANDISSAPNDISSEQRRVLNHVRSSQRITPTVMDEAILAICQHRWCTAEEIGAAVQRKVITLRTRYLPRLVEEGRLQLRYPNAPRHPHQAYRAQSTKESEPST